MCKVYHGHEEEESKRGHWVGRRKRKIAVIRAERHSKCRRMQVVPVVLDEVLFSCWATKLFIYKTLTAYGHGRENCYAYCSFCPVDVWLQSFCSQWWVESEAETHKSQPGLPAKFWLINTNDCWLRLSSDSGLFVSKRQNLTVRSLLRSKVDYTVWIHQIRGPADDSDIISNWWASGWGLHSLGHWCCISLMG